MNVKFVGDSAKFAIEYALESPRDAFGHVRLWFSGTWVGNFESPNFLAGMTESLASFQSHRLSNNALLFPTSDLAPRYEDLLGQVWSNEAFDDFGLVYYAIQSTKEIHFQWELVSKMASRYPGYPLSRLHCTVPFDVFDVTLGEWRNQLAKARDAK